MELTFTAADELFRQEIAQWLDENLRDEFAEVRHRGGPGDEHRFVDERKAWERRLAEGRWTCIGWPEAWGGRGASIEQQVIYHEEYARAGGPGRMGHIGDTLTGPTLLAFGSEDQKARYLPDIRSGQAFWSQGYSEPGAGSDLAAIRTRADFDDGSRQWTITGQKVWTSLAHESDFVFVLARVDRDSVGHRGLGFFLVALDQPGVTIRPINQLTGTAEFNEVYFDEAVCAADDIVGAPGDGWKVAMGLLGFERGVSTLGQQMLFQTELDEIIRLAKLNGASRDPEIRQRIAEAHIGLRTMRYNSMRTLSGGEDGSLSREAMIYKLYWSSWHRNLGKLAMDVLGPDAELLEEGPYELTKLQSLFLFTRADTIYGGTNQIQRNLIAERALGMPKEPRGQAK
ncbi:acyl-CoA dehydrogenase family protein [Luminiphilus sp.]|jgi:alkylation response protein AidB-like acyl-CoA dehydrogenase|nr:acyl-CoA dehydrogenase family protein [Luminiphilus sp.]MDA8591154.1 acyl-CoA dehydrogenase family protein [Luminiphilus sp.]MDB2313278.1 acyl-CoA dehydrogenase family protein [Luminiphilus sp.]MDB2434375.1 acyl-CoA dehydrogenase family protein [Luminiphilus sp.]MDB2557326.1 acyl-CoA dehydrogenase family protein [Luminiphilus sp.]